MPVPELNLLAEGDRAAYLADAGMILSGEHDDRQISLEDFKAFWCDRYPGLFAAVRKNRARELAGPGASRRLTGYDIRHAVAALSEAA